MISLTLSGGTLIYRLTSSWIAKAILRTSSPGPLVGPLGPSGDKDVQAVIP
jgi:hypothetical protein